MGGWMDGCQLRGRNLQSLGMPDLKCLWDDLEEAQDHIVKQIRQNKNACGNWIIGLSDYTHKWRAVGCR